MIPSGAALTAKLEREIRLRWQSHALLGAVSVIAVVGVAARVENAGTPATAEGLAICAAFGLLVWRLRAATPIAAVTGFLLTSCMYLGTVDQPNGSWRHTALPPGLALFILAFAATRFRRGHKEHRGLAESRRGRVASQVAANMGIASIASLGRLPSAMLHQGVAISSSGWLVALTAALAEAAADTVSSEVGQALASRPILITTLQSAPPGTDGAISFTGTLAGCVAGAALVGVAIPALRLSPSQGAAAWLAAVLGLFADSLMGATLERRGWLNNDAVNLLSTAVAAIAALLLIR